jgi:predicted nucleic acid-binding protein
VILYCDTSALMKLYAHEQHSDAVRAAVTQAAATMVSTLTWVEVHSAFSLKQRTEQVTEIQVAKGLARLTKEWDNFTRIAVDPALVVDAAKLAVQFGLRAYDSVQLASAHHAHLQVGAVLSFLCFDKQLNTAAQSLGLSVPSY